LQYKKNYKFLMSYAYIKNNLYKKYLYIILYTSLNKISIFQKYNRNVNFLYNNKQNIKK